MGSYKPSNAVLIGNCSERNKPTISIQWWELSDFEKWHWNELTSNSIKIMNSALEFEICNHINLLIKRWKPSSFIWFRPMRWVIEKKFPLAKW